MLCIFKLKNLKIKRAGVLALGMSVLFIAACSDPGTVAKVGDRKISEEEFTAYLNHKRIPQQDEAKVQKSLAQYLQREAMANAIKDSGLLNTEDLAVELREFEKQMLISRYFEKFLKDKVSKDSVRNYYTAHQNEFEAQKIEVAHILFRANKQMSEAERKAILTSAHEVHSKLQRGDDFAELASLYSDDKVSGKKGGALGWIKQGAVDKDFSAQVFSMPVGQVSEPFPSSFGFHIAKVISEAQTVKRPLESVSGDIRYRLKNQAKQNEIKKLIESVKVKNYKAKGEKANKSEQIKMRTLKQMNLIFFSRAAGWAKAHIALTHLAVLLMSFSLLNACEPKGTSVRDDSKVLATVNGTAISERQLRLHVEKRFADSDALLADAEVSLKVLESLVAGKSMAVLAKAELDQTELELIAFETARFEEAALSKAYLKKHVDVSPVTNDMVSAYYQKHPEKFGGQKIKTIEMVSSQGQLNETERDQWLKAIAGFTEKSNWIKQTSTLNKKLPIRFQQIEVVEGLLAPDLEKIVAGLNKGQKSNVSFLKDGITVVRVTGLRETPAKPLSEVSTVIRKSLAPIKLKEAVKKVSEKALSQVKVTYAEQTYLNQRSENS